MDVLLQDRVALVTGASRGIGRAIAHECARAGAHVAVNGRDLEKAEAVAVEVRRLNRQAMSVTADVRFKAHVERMVDQVVQHFGRIDILVNNAGIGLGPKPIETISEDEWDLVLATNLKGTLFCCQAVAPHMIRQGYGRIISISSTAAKYKPGATSAPYAASKAAISGMTRQMALLLGRHGITVNAILPGDTVTEEADKSWASLSEEDRGWMLKEIPFGRFGRSQDIAKAVILLASDHAGWIAGENVNVSGAQVTG
jgi:3-oxoacyl-[acyl-carrier protein] reductase